VPNTGDVKSLIIKRSIVLDGRKTSVSLEDEFWKCLRAIADERGETLSYLVSGIDARRKNANLSSCLRIFVLEFYRDQFAKQSHAFQQREIAVLNARR
jgi:predicted DNA-binding ribbon-helix-helix protein